MLGGCLALMLRSNSMYLVKALSLSIVIAVEFSYPQNSSELGTVVVAWYRWQGGEVGLGGGVWASVM